MPTPTADASSADPESSRPGEIDVAPLITGEVDLAGVPAAFDALAQPDERGKILVVPCVRTLGSRR